ncbi:MAG TPA: hypothetical protein VFJ82_18975 [Longimicrobium sp.]|nr:hypothetical protein [Longimicrobium sp.]
MLAQIPAVDVFPRRKPQRRDPDERGPFVHMLLFVAVSLVALAATQFEFLAQLGFWRAVSALAATGAFELAMMLLSYGLVRMWDSIRRR